MTAGIIVGPCGDPKSAIAIVGEAPGYEETKEGEPFVGDAGDLLNKLLASAGISRNDCYLTNVVKERPVDNKITQFIRFNNKGQAITSPEYDDYERELYRELSMLGCNVIVGCGNVGLWALCRLHGIYKYRGSILEATQGPCAGKKVIPIIHPAGALPGRDYLARYLISADLERVKAQALFPEIRRPKRNIIIQPSFAETMSYLGACQGAGEVAFDIETFNGQMSCISFALSPSSVISIPFARGFADYFTYDQEAAIMRVIGDILYNDKVCKIAQNIIFDFGFLFRRYGIIVRNFEDTMIGQGILYTDFPKGLDFISSLYTEEPYYKDEGAKHFKAVDRLPGDFDTFWRYNAKDSAVCLESWPQILQQLKDNGNLEAYWRQRDTVPALVFLQERGIRVDKDRREALRAEVIKEVDRLQANLNELCGFEINPKSPKQCAEYFYGQKGHKPFTKQGRVTADVNALTRLSIAGFKEAEVMLAIRNLRDLKSRYLDAVLDKDGRLRGAWNPVGTVSGRFSSNKTVEDTGANMQNQPPAVKRMLLPDEGFAAYNMDLELAENTVVAYIAPETNMIQAIEAGEDLHRLTAALIFGKRPEEISDVDGSSTIGGGKHSERYWGKKANHGFNYGEGPRRFALDNEIPEREAKFIRDRYFHSYPGLAIYHNWVANALREDRTLINCFGRRRHFLGLWNNDLLKEAYSFIPQSTIAENTNQKGLRYIFEHQLLLHGVHLMTCVHDNITFQIPISLGWDYHIMCLDSIRQSLQTPIAWRGVEFVIKAGIEIGVNLKDMVKVEGTVTPEKLEVGLEKSKEKASEPDTI